MRIRSTRVYICGNFIPAVIDIQDNIISYIDSYDSDWDCDFGSHRIIPGLIDVHCHGAYGFDTNYAEPDGLRRWTEGIVHEGVTSFLATTITQKKEILLKAVSNVRDVMDEGYSGAEILGIHFEGPYLDMKYKGAQPPEAIVPPSVEEFQEYQAACGGRIRIITMACEHDEDFALTRYASQHGTIVSMGHSDTTFAQAMMAVANGASSITHTYNAMSPLSHRENGLVGIALRLHDLYSEIICDCNHSTPEALHIFFHSKSRNRAIMISDALMCKGYEPGSKFLFGGHEIEIYPDGSAHLVKEKNLAGSTMKMNEGLRNLVEKAFVPFDIALNSCTLNPAAMLGVDDRKGRIRAGCDADIAVLDDSYVPVAVWCRGIRQF